jgi:hypothetical protein
MVALMSDLLGIMLNLKSVILTIGKRERKAIWRAVTLTS